MAEIHMKDRRNFVKTLLQGSAAAAFGGACLPALAESSQPSVHLNIRDFGATGDGTTLDTAALQRALDRANVLGGGEVLVPPGQYLTGSLSLRSNVTLRLAPEAVLLGSPELAHYEVAQVRWEGKWIPGYTALLHALDAHNIAVVGKGSIVGNKAVSGRPTKDDPLRRPALIETINCQGVRLEDFSTSYIHMWSIHPTCCDDLLLRNLTIRSTETNADGIDIDSCRRVLIDSCDIASGDDCISLKSGRGEEAYQMGRATEDVRIVNCTFEGRGFCAIGIGSETSAGIRNVVIEHCRVQSVYKFAIYIKSRVGRGAFIENIAVRDLTATNMRMGFLHISQTSAGIQDADPVPGLEGIPLFRNFSFEDIHLQNAPVLVEAFEVSAEKVLDGLTFKRLSGTCAKGMLLANMRNVVLEDVHVTGATPLLRTVNVLGKGIAGAEPLPTPAVAKMVAQPATPYRLH